MGGKGGKKVKIGYRNSMGIHMGYCAGPIDALLEVTGDGKTAWVGEQTTSGVITINAPNLYGGDTKEGGLQGKFTVMMGEATQAPNAYLGQYQGGLNPAYRGLFTAVFDGEVGAITPYVKPIAVRVRKVLKGWANDDCWEPTLAQVGRGMNPIHIIMRCLTDPDFAAGMSRSDIDLVNFRAAAVKLKDEDFGLCLGWRRSTPVDTFIGEVCDHIGAMMTEDPETLLQQIVLVRGDYDVNALVQVDESNITKLVRFQQTLLTDTVNEVTVKYHDLAAKNDANTAPAQNLANIQAQGRVVNQSTEYAGFYKGEQANRAAVRDCHAKSGLPASVDLEVFSSLWRIKRGDVIAFSWKRKGIVKMPLRVLEVNRGDRPNRPIKLTCVQDSYGLPLTTFLAVQPSGWQAPDTKPHPLPAQRVIEMPYRDLARRLRTADMQVLPADAGYLLALGARAAGVAYNFDIVSRVGSNPYDDAGSGDFCPGGLLGAAIGPLDTAIVITSPVDLDLVDVGDVALLDSEEVRIDAINTSTGAITIARGVADTVPVVHDVGARLWCYEDRAGYGETEYAGGETVQVKLLTRTAEGRLDPALATALSLTFNDRQIRPYPPGNLKIRGARYPVVVEGALVLTWSHRDRVLQADQLIDTLQTDIGPEPGTTYTVVVRLNGVVDSTKTGVVGNTFTPTVSANGAVTVSISAVRAGNASLQALSASFQYVLPLVLSGDAPDSSPGAAYNFTYTASGSVTPYTWSIVSGQLPTGVSLNPSTGALTGTTTTNGTFSWVVRVTSSTGVFKDLSDSSIVASGVASRYWRIYITAVDAATDGYTQIARLRLMLGGNELPTNGYTATASSNYSGFDPGKVLQSTVPSTNTDTWATATGSPVPCWLAIDCGTSVSASALMMYGADGFTATRRYPKDFKIQRSTDGSTWVDVTTVVGASSPASAKQYYTIS